MTSAVFAFVSRLALLRLALSGAAALLTAGCAGYRLGDPAGLPFQSVYVAPPINASLAPQAAALLGSAVTREIDRSGRAAIAAESSADVALAITITDYHRDIAAERADDTALARKWRVTLTAECTLTDRRTGKVYFTRRAVPAFDEVYADSGLVPAEYQNMPELTRRLGQGIAREVLAVW